MLKICSATGYGRSLLFGIIVFAGIRSPVLAADQPVTIRFATYLPAAAPQSLAAKWWADEVKRESGGRITVRLFYAGALVPVADGLPAVAQGRADMALIIPFMHARELPLTSINEIPFLSSDAVAAQIALRQVYETYPPFADEFSRANVHLMWIPPTGTNIIGSNKPITGINNLKDVRIRSGARLLSEALNAVGANVISLSVPELYDAMKRGVVDAYTSTPLANIPSFALQEVTEFVVDPGTGLFGTALHVMNKDFYQRLSENDRALLDHVGEEAAKMAEEFDRQADDVACEKIASGGGKVSVWSDAATAEWKAKVPDFLASWVTQHEQAGQPAREMATRYVWFLRAAEKTGDHIPGIRRCAARLAKP